MRRLIRMISTFFAILAALCVVAMMAMTVADVASRIVSGRSIPGAQELSEQLIVALVYLGMAYAFYKRDHVSVTICTALLSARLRATARLAGRSLLLAIVAWMGWRTGAEAWRSHVVGEVRFGLLQMPLWPARAAIPLGLAALALQVVSDMVDRVSDLREGRDSGAVQGQGPL